MARSEHPNPTKGEKTVKRHKPKSRPQDVYKSSDTLCWRCAKASTNGCAWSASFKPVNGWTAEPTRLSCQTYYIGSYRVIACPEFERG